MKTNITKLLTCIIVLISTSFIFINKSFGQASAYTFTTNSTGTLDAMTGATQLIASNITDGASTVTNIGFPFFYYSGATSATATYYTQFSVNSNGLMRLGSSVITGNDGGAAAPNSMSGANNLPKVVPLNDAFRTGTDGNVSYVVTGSYPSRILKIQWKVRPVAAMGVTTITFQAWLYETTGVIEFYYGVCAAQASSTIGISTANGNFHSVTHSNNTSSTSTANDANTAVFGYTGADARVYKFTPVTCSGTPAAPAITSPVAICSGTSTTLTPSNYAPPSGGGFSYQWKDASAVGGPYTNISGANNNTYATPVLSIPTYYQCVVTCSASGLTNTSNNVTVDINPIPTVLVSPTSSNYCTGYAGVSCTASGASTYSWSPSTGLSATTGATVLAYPSTTQVYTVTGTLAGCNNTAQVTITNVGTAPSISSVTATQQNICAGQTSQLNVTTISSGAYCTPAPQFFGATGTYINNFSFGGIVNNNTGDASTDYTYYSNLTANVVAGVPTAVSVQSGSSFGCGFRIWIDLNQDGTFQTTESVFTGGSGTAIYSGNITVPGTALNGTTRLRIYGAYTTMPAIPANTTSCTLANAYGEYEDYNVTITGATAPFTYAWTPAAGLSNSAIANPVTPALGSNTTYNITVSTANCSSSGSVTVNAGTTLAATPTTTAVPLSYCYPPSSYGNNDQTYYDKLLFNTINHVTPGISSPEYTYNSTQTTTLAAGNTYAFTVSTSGLAGNVGPNKINGWIDYNDDGSFSAGEQILNGFSITATATDFTSNITIPSNALNGTHRMRIRTFGNLTASTVGACTNPAAGLSNTTNDYDVTIVGGTNVDCPNVGTYQLSAGVTGGGMPYNYSWSPSTGLSSTTIANPVASNLASSITYTVTVTDNCGAQVVVAAPQITINPIPTVTVSPTSVTICSSGSTTLTGSGAATYNWSPNSSLNTYTGTTVIASPATTQVYTVTGISAAGCANTATATVTVGGGTAPQVGSVTATPSIVCTGSNSQLNANAYQVFTIGAGTTQNTTSTYPTPFANFSGSSHQQYLVRGTEMTGMIAGNITSLAFNLASGYASAPLENFSVKMANTALTALTSGTLVTAGFTTCLPATTYTPSATAGWNVISFVNNFNWTGGNIIVDVSFLNCVNCNGTSTCNTVQTLNGIVNQSGTAYVSSTIWTGNNNCTINSNSISGTFTPAAASQRPNMRFGQATNISYSWTPATFLSATNISNPAVTGITSTTSYFVTATNTANSCYAMGTATINVNSTNVTSISATPSTICSGDNSTLAAQVTSTLTGISPATYCTPVYTSGATTAQRITLIDISPSTLSSITGTSTTPWYVVYPQSGSTTCTLSPSVTYTVSVKGGSTSQFIRGWIDYNQNGTYESTETIGINTTAANSSIAQTYTFTVPASAYNGTTRARFRSFATAATITASSACNYFTLGETEEYYVTITGATPTSTYSWSPGTFLNSTNALTVGAVNATSTQNYTFTATSALSGCSDADGVTLTVNSAPTISDPVDQDVCFPISPTASFNVTAGGSSISTQWQVNTGSGFTNITTAGTNPTYSGFTSSTLNLSGIINANDGYEYRCVVTNTGCPSATSAAATLFVHDIPTVTNPSDEVVCLPTNPDIATFSVTAGGSAISMQWQVNTGSGFTDIIVAGTNPTYAGYNSAVLDLTGVITGNNGYQYRCVVSNAWCTDAVSSSATLTVHDDPVPLASNGGVYVAGQTINLFTTPNGMTAYAWMGPLSYTSSNQNPSILNAVVGNSGTYDVTVTDNVGCFGTSNTVVTVYANSGWVGNTPDWFDPANWFPQTVPSCATDAVIPTVPPGTNFPVISGNDASVRNLTIENGASLTDNNQDIDVCGDWTVDGGSFISIGNTTVSFVNTSIAQNISGTNTSHSFNNLRIIKNSQTLTLGGNTTLLDLSGDLIIESGNLAAAAVADINIKGDWTNNGGTFIPGSSIVHFDNTSIDQSITGASNNEHFNSIEIDKAGKILNVGGSINTLFINGNMIIDDGILNPNSSLTDFIMNGNWTINSAGDFNAVPSNVSFVNTSAPQDINGTNSTPEFDHLNMSKNSQTLQVAAFTSVTIHGNTVLGSGVLDFSGPSDLFISGNWTNNGATVNPGTTTAKFVNNTADQLLNGSVNAAQNFHHLVIDKNTFALIPGGNMAALEMDGNLTMNSGTLDDANNIDIELQGDWTNNGAVFIPGTGTVTFDNTTLPQNIAGTASIHEFHNISINKTANTLNLSGSSSTVNISGNMNIISGTLNAATSDINIKGNWINDGSYSAGTGTVTFNNSVPQSIGGNSVTDFNNLTINNNGSAVSLNSNQRVASTLNVDDGVLDLLTYSLNRITNGGSLNLANGTKMLLAGGSGGQNGSNFPLDFVTINLHPNSTVEYNGIIAQNIYSTVIYGHLTATNNSTKAADGNLDVRGNLLINSNATLEAFPSSTITVKGDWTNNGDFDAQLSEVSLSGTAGTQNLNGTSITIFYDFRVNNASGVNQTTDTKVSNSMNSQTGILRTGASTIFIMNPDPLTSMINYGPAKYIDGNLRRKINSSGSYDFPVGNSAYPEFATIDLNAIAGVNDVTVNFINPNDGAAPNPQNCYINGSPIASLLDYGYWNIHPDAQPTGGDYDVTLHEMGHTNPQIGNPEAYGVVKRANSASPWQGLGVHIQGTQSETGGVGTSKVSQLTSFSHFGIGVGNSGVPLPVTLISFKAVVINNVSVNVNWSTSSELNSDRFEIQRSKNGIDFFTIGEKKAAGYSNTVLNYTFSDLSPYDGISFYRLKQVNEDGGFEYTDISQVNISSVYSIAISPNPSSDQIILSITGTTAIHNISILDVTGRAVMQVHSALNGTNGKEQTIDIRLLPAGVYFAHIETQDGNTDLKFIKQ